MLRNREMKRTVLLNLKEEKVKLMKNESKFILRKNQCTRLIYKLDKKKIISIYNFQYKLKSIVPPLKKENQTERFLQLFRIKGLDRF